MRGMMETMNSPKSNSLRGLIGGGVSQSRTLPKLTSSVEAPEKASVHDLETIILDPLSKLQLNDGSDRSQLARAGSSLSSQEYQRQRVKAPHLHIGFDDDDRASSRRNSIIIGAIPDDGSTSHYQVSGAFQTHDFQNADISEVGSFVDTDMMTLSRDSNFDAQSQQHALKLIFRSAGEYLSLLEKALSTVKFDCEGWPLFTVYRSRFGEGDIEKAKAAKFPFVQIPSQQLQQDSKSRSKCDLELIPEFHISENSRIPSRLDVEEYLSKLFNSDPPIRIQDLEEIKDEKQQAEGASMQSAEAPKLGTDKLLATTNLEQNQSHSCGEATKTDNSKSNVNFSHDKKPSLEQSTSLSNEDQQEESKRQRNIKMFEYSSTQHTTLDVSSNAQTDSSPKTLAGVPALLQVPSSNGKPQSVTETTVPLESQTNRNNASVIGIPAMTDPSSPVSRSGTNLPQRTPDKFDSNADDLVETNVLKSQSQQSQFSMLENPLLVSFAEIPLDQFGQRLQYLADHHQMLLAADIVDEYQIMLFTQAVQNFRGQQQRLGGQCLHCFTLIQMAKKQPTNLQEFLQKLKTSTSSARRKFTKLLHNALLGLTRDTGPILVASNYTIPQNTNTHQLSGPGTTNLNQLRRETNPSLQTPSASSSSLRVVRSGQPQPTYSAPSTSRFEDQLSTGSTLDLTQFYPLEQQRLSRAVEPSKSSHPQVQKMSSKYRTRDGQKFFVRGKVFAILWHEPLGLNKNRSMESLHERAQLETNVTLGPHGEGIYNQIRRMIVIRSRRGYCWCISMGTYSGQGLAKGGLSPEEIGAHAIVYDIKKSPKLMPNEPRSPKRPIAIRLSAGESLDPATRVHFGKPYNVEWNVAVREIGQVVDEDLDRLLFYVKDELLGRVN